MNITVRLSDGEVDLFSDHHPDSPFSYVNGITRHRYEIGGDESLTIHKSTWKAWDDGDEYTGMERTQDERVAYYRPSQWTSVRET